MSNVGQGTDQSFGLDVKSYACTVYAISVGKEDSMDLLEEIACNFSQPHTFLFQIWLAWGTKGKWWSILNAYQKKGMLAASHGLKGMVIWSETLHINQDWYFQQILTVNDTKGKFI